MADNIIRFPGFILLEDRNTILKDGKRHKNMKALIDDLPHRDLKRTHDWYSKRAWPSRHRVITLARALYGDAPLQQGGAA
jgi:hypothetical protein